MARDERVLFYDRNLSDVFADLDARMQKEIDGFGKDLLSSKSVDDLCDSLEEKYRVDVPRLMVGARSEYRWLTFRGSRLESS